MWSWVLLCVCFGVGCRDEDQVTPVPGSEATSAAPQAVRAPSSRAVERRDLLAEIELCDVRHRGLSIDVGSSWGNTHRGYALGPFDDVRPTTRAGISTGAVQASKLSYDFWLDRPAKNIQVELRAQAGIARYISVDVDAFRVGHQALPVTAPANLKFGPSSRELGPGRHTVTLRFSGRRRANDATRAYVDWLRVFIPDNAPASYVAPTRANLLQDVALADQPRRSVALRAPGSVRCPAFPVKGTRLHVDLGYWGSGEGVAQIKVLTHDGRSVVVAEHEVKGDDAEGRWIPLELSLDAFHERLVALELVALSSSEGGRVLFGEPQLRLEKPRVEPTPARNVIVLLAGGLDRRLVPPWAERSKLPNLYRLADQSVAFDGYRTNSTLVSGVVAGMLTGARPNEHQMLDPAASLPEGLLLVSERMRRNSGHAGFFTNVPYSFAAFGFERGWNEFHQVSVIDDLPATEPLRVGRKWLEQVIKADERGKRLLFVHATAAHPPWDATVEDAGRLPPKEYAGSIEPRRAAVVLRELRNRPRGPRSLNADDWVRLRALQEVSMQKLDVALGLLMARLEELGQWDDSLVLFAGDVAMGDPPAVPFAPLGALDEGRLAAPLMVKFPGKRSSSRSQFRFGPVAVSRTLHESLDVAWEGGEAVPTLSDIESGGVGLMGNSGLLAMQGHTFAFYLGPWRLAGALAETPRLCNLEVDPTCEHDLHAEEPFVAQWMWRALIRVMRQTDERPRRRRSAEFDDQTRASLQVYGL